MKILGIIILVIGILMAVYTGFNLITKEKIVDIGKVEITQDKKHGFRWSPLMGVVLIAIGGGMYLIGSKKRLA